MPKFIAAGGAAALQLSARNHYLIVLGLFIHFLLLLILMLMPEEKIDHEYEQEQEQEGILQAHDLVTTVDVDDLPRNRSGSVTRQENAGRAQFRRLAASPQRRALLVML